jgi:ribosomal protein S18 acetylase RimI-like enzyme
VTAGLATARLSIRHASPADLDTVVALRLALLREERQSPAYGRVRPGLARRAHTLYRAQLESPGEVTLLAERDGVALGILRCAESNGHPLLEPDHYAYVSSVYVVPAARRAGVVRALLGHASQWCRDRGLVEMRLHNAADSAAANAAWEALGFTVVEHLRVHHIER